MMKVKRADRIRKKLRLATIDRLKTQDREREQLQVRVVVITIIHVF